MARKRPRLKPKIAERRLIGLMTCRIGLCDKDGTVGVDLPAYDVGGTFAQWVRVWRCEEHAQETIIGDTKRGNHDPH